jgi:hypothetical protein
LGLYQFFLAFKAEFGNLAARSGPSIFSTVTNFALKYRPEKAAEAGRQREKESWSFLLHVTAPGLIIRP